MAENVELRINMKVLKRIDPEIKDILARAKQVALYHFSIIEDKWEGTDIVGALFICRRNNEPFYNMIILNRMNTNNYVEPLHKYIELKSAPPFLLFTNLKKIYGIWFYNEDEYKNIITLIETIIKFLKNKTENSELNEDGEISVLLNRAQDEYTESMKIQVKIQESPLLVTKDKFHTPKRYGNSNYARSSHSAPSKMYGQPSGHRRTNNTPKRFDKYAQYRSSSHIDSYQQKTYAHGTKVHNSTVTKMHAGDGESQQMKEIPQQKQNENDIEQKTHNNNVQEPEQRKPTNIIICHSPISCQSTPKIQADDNDDDDSTSFKTAPSTPFSPKTADSGHSFQTANSTPSKMSITDDDNEPLAIPFDNQPISILGREQFQMNNVFTNLAKFSSSTSPNITSHFIRAFINLLKNDREVIIKLHEAYSLAVLEVLKY